jgi:hypothetical protein
MTTDGWLDKMKLEIILKSEGKVEFHFVGLNSKSLYAGISVPNFEPAVWDVATGALLTEKDWKLLGQIVLKMLLDAPRASESAPNITAEDLRLIWTEALQAGFKAGKEGRVDRLDFFKSQDPSIVHTEYWASGKQSS